MARGLFRQAPSLDNQYNSLASWLLPEAHEGLFSYHYGLIVYFTVNFADLSLRLSSLRR